MMPVHGGRSRHGAGDLRFPQYGSDSDVALLTFMPVFRQQQLSLPSERGAG